MTDFLKSLPKTSVTAVISMFLIVGCITMDIMCLYHQPANENIAILVLGNMHGLAMFVAGYYLNKKESPTTKRV